MTRFVKNVERVETRTANDAATIKIAPRASCPRGKRLIGGGAWVESSAFVPVALTANGPQGTAWVAAAYATAATGNWMLVNVAICGESVVGAAPAHQRPHVRHGAEVPSLSGFTTERRA